MATDYYEEQREKGQEYEDFVAHKLLADGIALVRYGSKRGQIEHGENAFGLEIKYDMKFAETGNFWIEVAERRTASGMWVPSGIAREDNTWLYGLGNYEEFFIFSKRALRNVTPGRVIRENDQHTSKGWLLPRKEATEFVERVFFWIDAKL